MLGNLGIGAIMKKVNHIRPGVFKARESLGGGGGLTLVCVLFCFLT